MKEQSSPLKLFHPLIGEWFAARLGAPTDIQRRAWPVIARGRHVLATAPTGSGKTLTAFLWAINQLLTGAWERGRTRVLYISPLKALNNDIRRNLTEPLAELKSFFRAAGADFPEIGVLTRSGDTPAGERRQMVRQPPEILITTPESLNILLSSRSGRAMLTEIATVILDEIHALVATKRGTHLITAVERLTLLAGEFQRLALSATVKPLAVVAEFVGGYMLLGEATSDHYEKRPVEIIQSSDRKSYRVRVAFPREEQEQSPDSSSWSGLVASFRKIIRENRSTLLFANSRRIAEKVARLINEGEAEFLAYAHHGSLSREIRLAVEQRLKEGGLRAIVATSSLELGIDIGDLDQVILIQTPPSVSAAIQRIGRSGHRVKEVSSGVFYPTHGHDFLYAAVAARCVVEMDIESLKPVECPLDVLAQVIISMTGIEKWDIDELYSFLKTSFSYRSLARRQFDLVLEMLAGRYADTRLRELRPRISLDKIDNTVQGKEGVLRLIYLSGGTITDRGYFDLRIQDSKARIGELDEEFVWERRIGDTFTLGTQTWSIRQVTHNDVEVVPVAAKPGIVPFWRAEDLNRDWHFSERILSFLEAIQARLADPSLRDELRRDYFLEETAVDELVGHLQRQQAATGAELPNRHQLLIEHCRDMNAADRRQVILHTLWGGRINRPLALALQAAWEEKYSDHLEIVENNDCLLLLPSRELAGADIFRLVTPENIERLLRRVLETKGFFGARFRENAGRAMLLPRADFKRRLPLWLNRLRSKKLLEAVLPYPDFPILLETWRTCLQDEFDLDHLRQLLDEIRSGQIKITEAITATPSPFAAGLIWKQTNTNMYEDDSPRTGKASRLSEELIKEVLFSSRLRPRLSRDLLAVLAPKLQRTAPGYAPHSADDFLDWVKERLFIPAVEWQALLTAMEGDGKISAREAVAAIRKKIVSLRLPGASTAGVVALENLPRLSRVFPIEPGELDLRDVLSDEPVDAEISQQPSTAVEESTLPDILRQWLSFYEPVGKTFLKEVFGLAEPYLDDLLAGLASEQELVIDLLTEGAEEVEVCDRDNLEILLRMSRKSRQPSFRVLPSDHLPLFLASYQRLTERGGSVADLQARLDQLFGLPAPAESWEKHFLPARLLPYHAAWLDSLMQSSELVWFGCGNREIGFAFVEDLELFLERSSGQREAKNTPAPADGLASLFPEITGRYSFFDILKHAGSDSRRVTNKLWFLAWQGRVTNDAFGTLRQGILTDFAPFAQQQGQGRPSRSAYNRWTATRPLTGHWYALDLPGLERDPLDEAELVKDRVRQLFKRYGLIFRELLAGELPGLQWSRIFRALRLMELSGEILSGHFFEGIPGRQFITPEAFRLLEQPLPDASIYWLNATDPASLCGLKLPMFQGRLPSRLPSTHLVYHGKKLVLISRRNGNTLKFLVSPEDPNLPGYLSLFKELLTREFKPEKMILVGTINAQPALTSEYANPLLAFGFTKCHKGLELVKHY